MRDTSASEPSPDIDLVVDVAAMHFGVSREQLLAGGRFRRQRQLAHYVAHRLTGCSLSQIGAAIGGVEHTNALHSIYMIRDAIAANAAFAETVASLCSKVTALRAAQQRK